MKTSLLSRALQASVWALLATNILAQTSTQAALGSIQTLACYSDPKPLVENKTDTFQTSGACQTTCGVNGHFAVMAITGGSTCYCGNVLPSLDKQVDISKCNSPCNGFDQQTCGGIGYWQVYLTGISGDVSTAPNSTSSTSATSSTKGPQTVVVTASSSAKPSESPVSGGPNKVGIAVGVVIGVLVIAGMIGGCILYMKQKRRKEIEEEHKAQAAVNSFVGSRSSDAKSDQRLDPSMASYRRESIGSIADERDFSRRILQVRNPDRGSLASVA